MPLIKWGFECDLCRAEYYVKVGVYSTPSEPVMVECPQCGLKEQIDVVLKPSAY